jgi:hypothetical protein
LSWNNKLQDNYYYQEFSYVVRLTETVDKYKDIVKSLLHPAGTIMFGDYIINSKIDLAPTVIDEATAVVRRSSDETITTNVVQNATAVFNTNINVTEPVTSVDTLIGGFVANTNITESVTSTASHTGTFVASTSRTESVTPLDTLDGIVVANLSASESITLSEVNTAAAEYLGSIGVLILDYAPFLISSESSTQISNITINLYDIVDATIT